MNDFYHVQMHVYVVSCRSIPLQ